MRDWGHMAIADWPVIVDYLDAGDTATSRSSPGTTNSRPPTLPDHKIWHHQSKYKGQSGQRNCASKPPRRRSDAALSDHGCTWAT